MKENNTTKLPFFGITKLLPHLKPYRIMIPVMVLFGLLGTATDIIIPMFQKYAINNFIKNNTVKGIVAFVLAYLVVIIIQALANLISCFLACKIELGVGRDLKQKSFEHLQTLSFSYFNRNNTGYVHAHVMSDTDRIGTLVSWGLMDGVWNLSYVVGVIFTMLFMNWKLGLLILAIIPFAVLLSWIFQKKLVTMHRQIREENSKITSNFSEGISGADTIKTLTVEDKIGDEFRHQTGVMRKVSVKSAHYNSLFSATLSLCSYTALALVLWRGGLITIDGLMLIGTLSVFIQYALGIMGPVQWFVSSITMLIGAQVNIERFTTLMETTSDVVDSPEVIEKYGDTFSPKRENWEELHGHIEFRDVSFKYPDGEELVLDHFDLDVPKGTNVAIVGETGAGKSTLVNLVCRFFEPSEGSVYIDGRDAKERSQLWLHSNIGYVLQTPHLFSGTIRDNLKYGNPNATDEEIMEALKTVSADKIIDRLEAGLDSEAGEGGGNMSTGEKQLLSFARAILADPRILILDEATSSVDTETEKLIQDAIKTVIAGRTSFIIAHRLSTIVDSDVILAVKAGKIVESGTHSELMKKNGYYAMLYKRQFEDEATAKIFT